MKTIEIALETFLTWLDEYPIRLLVEGGNRKRRVDLEFHGGSSTFPRRIIRSGDLRDGDVVYSFTMRCCGEYGCEKKKAGCGARWRFEVFSRGGRDCARVTPPPTLDHGLQFVAPARATRFDARMQSFLEHELHIDEVLRQAAEFVGRALTEQEKNQLSCRVRRRTAAAVAAATAATVRRKRTAAAAVDDDESRKTSAGRR